MDKSQGLCECGCGQKTPLAVETNSSKGQVKGRPIRFVHGHNARLQRPSRVVDPADRFWRYVDVRTDDECWRWTGGFSSRGYGQIRGAGNRMVGAHKFALELRIGPLPSRVFACHSCDHKWCVNPRHLFPGLNRDNILDAVSKGLAATGERVGTSKLKASQVAEIRRLSLEGRFQRDIAAVFGVSQYCVWAILNGRNWKHD